MEIVTNTSKNDWLYAGQFKPGECAQLVESHIDGENVGGYYIYADRKGMINLETGIDRMSAIDRYIRVNAKVVIG